jgi:hypothetical protein
VASQLVASRVVLSYIELVFVIYWINILDIYKTNKYFPERGESQGDVPGQLAL